MTKIDSSAQDGQTELKVFDGSEPIHGAAVTMDDTRSVGPAVSADAAAEAPLAEGKTDAGAAADSAAARPEGGTDVAGAPMLTTEQDGDRPEHKKQLRERIEARRQELADALSQLEALEGTAPKEMVLAIQTSLQALEVHVGGGWDHVGEVEAQQLAQWLDSTQHLGAVTPKDDAALADQQRDEGAEASDAQSLDGVKMDRGPLPAQKLTPPSASIR